MKIRTREEIAGSLLKAICEQPTHEKLLGSDVTMFELAYLVVKHIGGCPNCGATAGVNIDCRLCQVIIGLEQIDNTA